MGAVADWVAGVLSAAMAELRADASREVRVLIVDSAVGHRDDLTATCPRHGWPAVGQIQPDQPSRMVVGQCGTNVFVDFHDL